MYAWQAFSPAFFLSFFLSSFLFPLNIFIFFLFYSVLFWYCYNLSVGVSPLPGFGVPCTGWLLLLSTSIKLAHPALNPFSYSSFPNFPLSPPRVARALLLRIMHPRYLSAGSPYMCNWLSLPQQRSNRNIMWFAVWSSTLDLALWLRSPWDPDRDFLFKPCWIDSDMSEGAEPTHPLRARRRITSPSATERETKRLADSLRVAT